MSLSGKDQRVRVVRGLYEAMPWLSPEGAVEFEEGILRESARQCVENDVPPSWSNTQFEVVQKRLLFTALRYAGDFKSRVPRANVAEMMSSFWAKQIEEKRVQDSMKQKVNETLATDQFECRKCHQRKCVYQQMQTRSADEPMTTIITCLVCGKRWRE